MNTLVACHNCQRSIPTEVMTIYKTVLKQRTMAAMKSESPIDIIQSSRAMGDVLTALDYTKPCCRSHILTHRTMKEVRASNSGQNPYSNPDYLE